MNSAATNVQHHAGTRKTQRAWTMYDWANSAYNLVITSTIFPAYYEAITTVRAENGDILTDKVSFFGASVKNSTLFEWSIAAAYLLIAFLSPILSSIADLRGTKRRFLALFSTLGGLACCGLFFFTPQRIETGIVLAAIAALGYCGSLVFYHAYLPEIATPEERDRLSARGFAMGYIGSVILQIVCFLFVLMPKTFGLEDEASGSRLSFLLVGIWWIGWAQIPLRVLPKGTPQVGAGRGENILTHGFRELGKVWSQVKSLPVLKRFLGAFFFYSAGVQTVMLAATIFGSKELNMEAPQLIATILVIQLVAIAGAYGMARLSKTYGNLRVLAAVVVVWIGVCIAAYFIQTAVQFYVLAAVVGLVMGGIQSLSRSTYSKLMPETRDTASFFSFYDVTEKVAIVLGMFSFGFIDQLMGNMRYSIIALIVFFAIGLALLFYALRAPSLLRTSTPSSTSSR